MQIESTDMHPMPDNGPRPPARDPDGPSRNPSPIDLKPTHSSTSRPTSAPRPETQTRLSSVDSVGEPIVSGRLTRILRISYNHWIRRKVLRTSTVRASNASSRTFSPRRHSQDIERQSERLVCGQHLTAHGTRIGCFVDYRAKGRLTG
jgi:hypothetical protein